MTANHYDIVVIGSGAGGATLASHLASSGKRILILERGQYLLREKANWDPHSVIATNRYQTSETWYDRHGTEFRPTSFYHVGGATKVYGSAMMRFRERDFREVLHYAGTSPAWPLTYTDFAPYYTLAERLFHVHGQRGQDPHEPPEREPFPYPPVTHEPRIQQLHEGLTRIGYAPFSLPLGLMLDESRPERSQCIKCSTCLGYPCLVNGKADAQIVGVDPALTHSNVTLATGCYVERLETNGAGTEVTHVHLLRNGVVDTVKGDVVVVACGAINSALLLLRSANRTHPNGLANSSGVVGRHYMCHNSSALMTFSLEPNETNYQTTLGMTDFYFEGDAFPFPLGNVQLTNKTDAALLQKHAPIRLPRFILRHLARRALGLFLMSEDLPVASNRVSISANGSIRLSYTKGNMEGHNRLVKTMKALLPRVASRFSQRPFAFFHRTLPLASTAHQCGTIRFGSDPKSSALNIHCKAHDVENLYVVDSSFFPSSAAVNPCLTVVANALRVGDHLLGRFK